MSTHDGGKREGAIRRGESPKPAPAGTERLEPEDLELEEGADDVLGGGCIPRTDDACEI